MINRIIEFSANNRLLVFASVVAAMVLGWWSLARIPLDAIPDLSDTQVIVLSRWDRSPDIIEDQVTYPIVASMLSAPNVKTVRGVSDFGYSFVYVIFEEGTDIYWARSRTLEYLSAVQPRLPQGVQTEIGPDASGVGWVYQYAILDRSGRNDLAALRSVQDWYLRYQLEALPGVAQVAPVGGFVRQYQIQLDPNRLQAYGISMPLVLERVRQSNEDVGGRLLEAAGAEYMVRGLGYARSVEDLRQIPLKTSATGTSVRIGDIATVTLGPDIRRGIAEWNGEGEVVSGIVVMRQGANAVTVIDAVRQKLEELKPGLPEGIEIVTGYDRSELIQESIQTLNYTITEELIVVSLVILIFLWHVPSALIPIFTIPAAILISFIPMQQMGVSANIMSLGGIAIAIGAMVDAAIVVVEQTHKKLDEWERTGRQEPYRDVVVNAVKEVGGPSFFALLVIAVAFLPVLALEDQEGRLFKPLAYTKNLSMIVAAVLAITLDPALRLTFTHMRNFSFRPRWIARVVNAMLVGKIHSEDKHPISRVLIRVYEPIARWTLNHKGVVMAGTLAAMLATIPVYQKLGSEFMPPLDEGTLMYMPTTLPGISVAEASRLLQVTDKIIMQFPEVKSVLGKAGRAETSTDPAPLSMFETVVVLKPKSEWRGKETWYDEWAPRWLRPVLRRITPDHISQAELVNEMNAALRIPGLSNSWTQPVRGRIDMLTTGIRTPVGLKISGADLAEIERLGASVERLLPQVAGTRSVFAERTSGGYFLDFEWKREELARYGLAIADAQMAVTNAIGGENLSTTIEGRERYPIQVRYGRDFRSDIPSLERVLIPVAGGAGPTAMGSAGMPPTAGRLLQVPLGQLARIVMRSGPSMLRNENGLLTGYVFVDLGDRDVGSYLEDARRLVREQIAVPPGYTLSWSGQYEALERVKEKLWVVLPVTVFLIYLLLYLNTRSNVKTAIILLAVPFSAIGAIWLLWALGYHMSIGVWVGLIALLGVDAETAVFMLLYLDLSYQDAKKKGLLRSAAELREAVVHGAVQRVRPKLMTVATMFIGLLPILWSTGAGSDVMKRIAAPMIGGVATSFLLELLVYPAIYEVWKWHSEVKKQAVA
ncbi:MAG: efflux RND transporter permease subunit [Bryobacterales bacterium]|nr:efflux RND transporter permease subunit [Bryobacterales bacterium]